MLLLPPAALILIAQAAVAAPPAAQSPTVPSQQTVAAPPAPDGCRNQVQDGSSRTIVVCAQRPQGYRIDPDVLKAKREARNRTKPRPPETMKQNTCAIVGPMGCRGNPGIDLVQAATVLGEMAARASRGEDVGQMFVTDPQPSEYQLYLEAKKEREAAEAQAKAKARTKAAQAQAATIAPVGQPAPASAPVSAPAPARAQ